MIENDDVFFSVSSHSFVPVKAGWQQWCSKAECPNRRGCVDSRWELFGRDQSSLGRGPWSPHAEMTYWSSCHLSVQPVTRAFSWSHGDDSVEGEQKSYDFNLMTVGDHSWFKHEYWHTCIHSQNQNVGSGSICLRLESF